MSSTTVVNYTPGTTKTVDIPTTEVLFLTLVGAGGSTNTGFAQDGLYYSSGGAGSGASVVSQPVFLVDFANAKSLNLYCGKGGKDAQNGEDSYVELLDAESNVLKKFTAQGGFAGGADAENITFPGKGGDNIDQPQFSGQPGEFGMVLPPSCSTSFGGNGANSYFSKGGLGALRYNDENSNPALNPQNGHLGSGAGGCVLNSALPQGGNGFVVVEF